MTRNHSQDALPFLRANLITARVLAREARTTFSFTNRLFDPLDVPYAPYKIELPNVVNLRAGTVWQHLRMRIDTGAAWVRYQTEDYAKYISGLDENVRQIYEAFEKARREVLLAQEYPGVAQHIFPSIKLKDRSERDFFRDTFVFLAASDILPTAIAEGVYCAALYRFLDNPLILSDYVRFLGKMWSDRLQEIPAFQNLASLLHDPDLFYLAATQTGRSFYENFERMARPLKRTWLVEASIKIHEHHLWLDKPLPVLHLQLVSGKTVRFKPSHNTIESGNIRIALSPSIEENHNDKFWPRKQPRQEKRKGRKKRPSQKYRTLQGAMSAYHVKSSSGGFGPEVRSSVGGMDLESIPEKDRPLIIELGKVFEEIDLPPGDRSSPRVSSATIELQARKGQFLAAYRKLRQDHEEVVTVPEMLPDKEALQEAWQKLQKEYSQQARTSRRLGRKLENWLKSQTGTQPTPECEEGQIDLGRLAGIVSNPNNPNIYTGEAPAPRLSTAVSLLFDYSASMGGEQIITANLLSHQVVTALERCRIASEVLGFTTNDDKSLHIVVKDYRQRLQSAENNFGIAGVQEKMGGTNDTDAILWATDRLLKRSEDRKILVVVSDIQPNVSFIRSEFPDLHYDALLKSVIMHIERMKGVEIIGIGIDTHTSASHYYANGINLKGPKELGPVLIAKLQQVLGPKEVHASLRALNKPAVSKSRTAVPA